MEYETVTNGFQSTHPVRGATLRVVVGACAVRISIHAPREGCDRLCNALIFDSVGFQSTHPVRGATTVTNGNYMDKVFQSTHPVRGATPQTWSMRP